MFKKLFARVGIGSASVDAVLTTDHFSPGETVTGRIEIKGGEVEQEIAAISLKLMTVAKKEGEDLDLNLNHVIAEYRISEAFCLQPGDEKVIPFSFELHPETPVTVLDVTNNRCKVWLETALDIEMALDPTDRDYLNIHPSPVIRHFIDAMNKNGFRMVKADVEKGFLRGDTFQSESGCYQEMEFKPARFSLGRTREVELSFVINKDRTHVLVELDRAFAGDGYRSLTVSNHAGYSDVETRLKTMIG
ncbi:MAG: sporulation protein [Desulfobacterales bacterium]|nr:sporulation protein [Desulfobacterales bacterium]